MAETLLGLAALVVFLRFLYLYARRLDRWEAEQEQRWRYVGDPGEPPFENGFHNLDRIGPPYGGIAKDDS